tara:strand:- start:40 stop:411 length:372 start_codon:yes stop_codon:yes gene_type:complete
MGYSISLSDSKGTVQVPSHVEGMNVALVKDDKGCIEVNGTRFSGGTFAELDLPRQYGRIFPFKELHGKVAADVVEEMEDAVGILKIKQDEDFYRATPGNAGHALNVLVQWARAHPQATFHVYY